MTQSGGSGEGASVVTPADGTAPAIAPGMPSRLPGPGPRAPHQPAQGRGGVAKPVRSRPRPQESRVYAALDLGTNNCRLLVAHPTRRGFKVIDAFSRIIRLGEGVSASRRLSEAAIERTLEALKICAAKMRQHRVERAGLIATEACRLADNAPQFLSRVRRETNLNIEVVSREAEARLAVSGCTSLIDASTDLALVFDIGGGSSELIWLDLACARRKASGVPLSRLQAQDAVAAWTSLPAGVVTLAERYDNRPIDAELFEAMVGHVSGLLLRFVSANKLVQRMAGRHTQLLGTSGTVTTVAGVHLELPRYDRRRIDGCWLGISEARAVTARLLASSHAQRVAQPCIGKERADLVLAGCAILEAVLRTWPCARLRVADRGLREGILATLMDEDGLYRPAGRRRRGRR
jgi:exopolyphosphatase/guanosine-5'-triphosphate,3'-diphosphate pyrophosphatase